MTKPNKLQNKKKTNRQKTKKKMLQIKIQISRASRPTIKSNKITSKKDKSQRKNQITHMI